ncbi:MAG: tripartite tricarboxylate transporter substrate binding protein [Rubrivivax sp.]|nr:tripartite tricarboxylate transporter substrate binding protein [Rubrivivax sp.]MCL4698325.1 tripartite tricarboxylate transporter substrate binding protein [Burkholderiaceae bacterium]
MPHRRQLLLGLGAGLAAWLAGGRAAAQAWPARPVRVVVPFTPGGNVDVMARLVNRQLDAEFGQSFVAENLAGASGAIGAQQVARARPDGHTLLANSSIHVILPSVQANLGYDPLNDFIPVAQVTEVPLALVVSADAVPARTHAEFVAWAKAQPRPADYATFIGASSHLAAELWGEQTGVKVNTVPYKAGTSAQVDVVAGRVTFQMEALLAASPLLKAGKLRALAVTSGRRVPAYPDVPTFAELGLAGIDTSTWHGFWAPKGTPQEVVDRLGAAIVKAAGSPEVRERIEAMGGLVAARGPQEFAAFCRRESARWAALARRAGVEPK